MEEKLRCKQLERLPVVTEWQGSIHCPSCKHYFKGKCSNPDRTKDSDPCPFDDKELVTEPIEE